MSSKHHNRLIGKKRVALVVAAATMALAACGGGGGGGGDGSAGDGGAAATPPQSTVDLPFVVDLARRADVKRALVPLLAGTYGETCHMSNAAGQLVEGGGPVVVDGVGARASAASSSMDLLADGSSDFTFIRYFPGAMGDTTAAASISYGTDPAKSTLSIAAMNDALTGPQGVAIWSGSGDRLAAGCAGPAPALSSADLFGVIRRFIADAPVRMRNCVSASSGTASASVAAGEVRMGARDITVNGVQANFDTPGKQAEGIVVSYGRGATLEYHAKWQERDVTISMDDAGNIHDVLIGDTGAAARSVRCQRPVR